MFTEDHRETTVQPPETQGDPSVPGDQDLRPPPAAAGQQHSTNRIADAPAKGPRHHGPGASH